MRGLNVISFSVLLAVAAPALSQVKTINCTGEVKKFRGLDPTGQRPFEVQKTSQMLRFDTNQNKVVNQMEDFPVCGFSSMGTVNCSCKVTDKEISCMASFSDTTTGEKVSIDSLFTLNRYTGSATSLYISWKDGSPAANLHGEYVCAEVSQKKF